MEPKTRIHRIALGMMGLLAFCTLGAAIPPKTNPSFPRRPQAFAGRMLQNQADYGRLPLAFEPNQGQTDPQVQYLAHGQGYSLFLTSQEAVLVLKKSTPQSPVAASPRGRKGIFTPKGALSRETSSVLRLKLEGAAGNPSFEGQSPLPGVSNYFLGRDRSQWRRNVPQYGKVVVTGVYPGVDMAYYGNQGRLEYDFIVGAGTDSSVVHLKYEGAKAARVNAGGDLELDTDQGTLRFLAPRVYQEQGGSQTPVEGRYRLDGGGKIGFDLGSYDHSRPLVIDPVLDYSTYWGGTMQDAAYGIALDASGNAYITGITTSANFPVTNAVQTTETGPQNAFVAEINASGTTMLFSTYLGGSGTDTAYNLALDPSGDIYIVGATSSTNFPTVYALQPALSNPYDNLFVTELSPGGGGLVYSTYLGGSGNGTYGYGDYGYGIAVDGAGNAYVGGLSASTNFPTANALQPAMTAVGYNAVLVKIAPNGASLVYSTYLGGTTADAALGVALDGAGDLYAAGYSYSADFPVTNAANLQTTAGGGEDAFLAELSAGGTSLVYSTYLGGSGTELASAVAVDPWGNAYVTGNTNSPNFPTQNPIQAGLSNSYANAFLTEVASGGASWVYSTYLGGSGNSGYSYGDYGQSVAVDNQGYAYVAGYTWSADFPTANALQPAKGGPYANAFAAQVTIGGSALMYSTYLGGNYYDQANGLAVDNNGNAYVTGYTGSPNFPTAGTPPQPSLAGAYNVFISEIAQPLPPTPTPTFTSTPTLTSTNTATSTATPTPSSTPTNTPTWTPTATPTQTPTNTPSSTPTLTSTASPSATPTSTATVTATATPVILTVTIGDPYPNPISKTGLLQIPLTVPTGSVAHWTVYTTGFRKVYENDRPVAGNIDNLSWDLRDQWGTAVANGLYYIHVQVSGLTAGSRTVKVLVIR